MKKHDSLDADKLALQIIDAMKGQSERSNARYLAHRLEAFAEVNTVYLRDYIRLLKEDLK